MAVANTQLARQAGHAAADSAPASVGESGLHAAPEAGPPSVEETLADMRARIDFLEHRIYVMESKQKGATDE